jgi:diadenosine tetraphosphatase ApaH/serine/threonine PP2A family protein phosphatase
VHSAFDWLPLAAVVGNAVLVLHGGIGDGRWRVDDLRSVKRPLTDETSSALVNQVVWSDPAEGSELSVKAGHPSPRDRSGALHSFSSEETQKFCKENGLQLVVRSHQVVRNGFQIQHGGRLVTVFSAPSYCGRDSNDSAIALITLDEDGNLHVKFKTFSSADTRPPHRSH